MAVYTLVNKTKRNLVVSNEKGKRVNLLPAIPVKMEGDFSEHPWVRRGWMTATAIIADAEDVISGPAQAVQEDASPESETPVSGEKTEDEPETPSQEDRGHTRKSKR